MTPIVVAVQANGWQFSSSFLLNGNSEMPLHAKAGHVKIKLSASLTAG